MKFEDLPKRVRDQVRLDDTPKPRHTRKAATEPGMPLKCSRCAFVADPPTEGRLAKHQAENPTHGRFEMML